MIRLRNWLVAGLIVLIPLVCTVFVIKVMFDLIDGFLKPLITRALGMYIPGLGLATTFVIILFTGLLATNYLGGRLIHGTEAVLSRVPLIKGVYVTSKQIVDAFFHPESTPFKQVCMLEYPRRGVYTIGFVTGEIAAKPGLGDEDLVNLFVPATPNPTFGYYIIVPKSDIIFLDMGVDEGLKLVVSGGIIMPGEGEALFKRNKPGTSEHGS